MASGRKAHGPAATFVSRAMPRELLRERKRASERDDRHGVARRQRSASAVRRNRAQRRTVHDRAVRRSADTEAAQRTAELNAVQAQTKTKAKQHPRETTTAAVRGCACAIATSLWAAAVAGCEGARAGRAGEAGDPEAEKERETVGAFSHGGGSDDAGKKMGGQRRKTAERGARVRPRSTFWS